MKSVLNKIVNSQDGIHAAFLLDQDGLPIEEVGLSATLGADSASSVSSSIVSFFHSPLGDAIGATNFVLSRSQRFMLILARLDGSAILGILAGTEIDFQKIIELVDEVNEPLNRSLRQLLGS
jgi:predicted regulator of Ras-like GTPase activity (Roadblock/LC7/MglB family)